MNDNAKGPAKSAGAQLRRYGEQALREDVQGLLAEWEDEVRESERIFFRASVSNRKMFWDWEGSPIQKGQRRHPAKRFTVSYITLFYRRQALAYIPFPN